VLSGIPESTKAQVHDVDGRGKAIALAAYLADVSDTILVAGKGAETGQQIGGIVQPFDDRLRLRDALRDAHTARGGAHDADEGRGPRSRPRHARWPTSREALSWAARPVTSSSPAPPSSTRARSPPATCSRRSAASTSTATPSSTAPGRRAPRSPW